MTDPWIWQPDEKTIAKANVTAFMREHGIEDPALLVQNASTGIEWFWDSSVRATKIDWFEPYSYIVDASQGFPFTRWFIGGKLNITHNCVDRHALNKKTAKKVAHIWQGECGAIKKTTYAELFATTNQVANVLRDLGIGHGDAVALYLPMLPELLPIFFAIMKVGAFVVPIFSGFGTDAVNARFADARVKVVFTADGTLRRGQTLPLKSMLEDSLKTCSTLKKCIVVRRLFDKTVPMTTGRDVFFDEIIAGVSTQSVTDELPSDHECLVIYTSGTTGKPKGTVHTHAGVLAQVTKEHYFHFDLKPDDIFFWVTDIGWMMGPWEFIGVTHFAATVVSIEGAPTYPKPDRIFTLSEREKVTHLGLSPTLVRLMMRNASKDFLRYKLKELRMIGSTGESWDLDSYLWCFEHIGKKRAPIINISGGTELMGCLLAPLPVLPLKACSLQGPALGMAVDIFDEQGQSVPPNEVGYLVCKKPAPSMTKGFLHDKTRYLETYFSKFPKVWNHGDWAVRDEDGQWFLRGRADDTIKISGKRTGPAEIESCLCDHPLVSEACAFGVPDAVIGESLVCFVVLQKQVGFTGFLKRELKAWISGKLGKTLSPSELHCVTQLPKTRSGKIVRGLIKKQYLGETIADVSSLENPQILREMPQKQGEKQ